MTASKASAMVWPSSFTNFIASTRSLNSKLKTTVQGGRLGTASLPCGLGKRSPATLSPKINSTNRVKFSNFKPCNQDLARKRALMQSQVWASTFMTLL